MDVDFLLDVFGSRIHESGVQFPVVKNLLLLIGNIFASINLHLRFGRHALKCLHLGSDADVKQDGERQQTTSYDD